jgi:hypothetical protein
MEPSSKDRSNRSYDVMTLRDLARSMAPACVVGCLLFLTACGGGEAATPPPTASVAAVRPSSTAHLRIVSPRQNEVITGPMAPLSVKLTGAEIVPQTSTDLKPDQGHLHVYLDGELVSMTSSAETTLADLAPGEHLVKVEFVATDHAPFDPRVIAAVSFEVEP